MRWIELIYYAWSNRDFLLQIKVVRETTRAAFRSSIQPLIILNKSMADVLCIFLQLFPNYSRSFCVNYDERYSG